MQRVIIVRELELRSAVTDSRDVDVPDDGVLMPGRSLDALSLSACSGAPRSRWASSSAITLSAADRQHAANAGSRGIVFVRIAQ